MLTVHGQTRVSGREAAFHYSLGDTLSFEPQETSSV